MSKGSGFIILFGVFWSAMTLLFDGMVLVPATKQLRALRYPSTEGTVLSSHVKSERDSEGGTKYHVAISYNYQVGEDRFAGDRFDYGEFAAPNKKWAYEAVAARPPGTKVRVFYRPGNPQDSILSPGLSGSDLFLFAFMMPFNAVMFAFWAGAWGKFRRRWFNPAAGGVKIITRLKQTRVRLTTWSPVATGIATIALLAFASIFIVGFLSKFAPSLSTMLAAWGIILGAGIAAGCWRAFHILSGRYDLIIDELNGTLDFPAGPQREMRQRVSLNSVEGLFVDRIETKDSDGDPSLKFAPTVKLKGETPGTELVRLVEWVEEDKANRFVQWLGKRLPQQPAPARPRRG
jgi:hypothetical protein